MRRIVGLMMLVVSMNLAMGQGEDPKVVLDKMSSVYKAMPGFHISFVQKVISESEVVDRFTGSADVSKEQFIIRFRDQHIYCNGSIIWTYLTESQELTIANFEPEDSFINPSNVYDIYKEGFTYEYKRQENLGGELVHVIELISTDEDSDFTNVIMYIGKDDSYLKAWDLIDYDGIKTSFEVSNFKPSQNYDAKHFVFDYDKNPVTNEEDFRN
ncbi:MAG: outer membrane lipoprotein carrier protein LolA [Roseivirga sp.]|nr:outer membrane lipoprotein carrier protein LolA [Roseivirga sp.]